MRYVVVNLGHLLLVSNPNYKSESSSRVPYVRLRTYHYHVYLSSDCISSSCSQCDEPFMHVQQCMLNSLAVRRPSVRDIQHIR
jgi:hypothetical protein